ncbi:MAG: FKBP-type peptidyl-prolyl cis-trans isomerase [Treponema sp.]|jgi:FKBP-type peptidyl-prolyl cis-trans isomerase FkpA|nr:FKBP-type peptidyl-prolyl cis-trans isomerase [Treponema sp.]
MKRALVFLCCIFAAGSLFAKGIEEEVREAEEKSDTSYAFGMVIAGDLVKTGLEFNYYSVYEGLRAVMEKEDTRISMNSAIRMVQSAFQEAMAKQAAEAQAAETVWLEENGAKEGVTSTETGLQYQVLTEGEGEQPGPMAVVKVHYEGSLTNGTVFDSSRERGEPVEFPLEAVIPGWAEGIQTMKTGGTSLFFIPSSLAYGSQGAGQAIPPYSTLIFTVELLEIVKREASRDDLLPPAAEEQGQN